MNTTVKTRSPELVETIQDPPVVLKPLEPWMKILLKAADILDKTGWVSGAFFGVLRSHCAVGAMATARFGRGAQESDFYTDPLMDEAGIHMAAYLARHGEIDGSDGILCHLDRVVQWNDGTPHGKHDVANHMRKCVEEERVVG